MDLRIAVEKKAYELFEKSGCICGFELDHWLEAEKIVYAGFPSSDGNSAVSIVSEPVNADYEKPGFVTKPATTAKTRATGTVRRTVKKTVTKKAK